MLDARSDGPSFDQGSPLVRSAPLAAGIAAALVLVAPRGAAVALVVLAVVLAVLTGVLAKGWPHWTAEAWPPSGAWLLVAAFGTYIALNATWSVHRVEAFGKVLFYGFAAVLAAAAISCLPRVGRKPLEQVAWAVLAAVGLGTAYLLAEVLLDQGIARAVATWLPLVRPDPKHATIVDGKVVAIGGYVLNRNLAVLCLLLFPALLMARALLPRPAALALGIVLALGTVVAAFNSQHETSMLALVFAGAAFVGLWLVPALTRNAVLAGWLAATLLVVPIALASYAAGLHQAGWIPETGRNRIILWNVTGREVARAPLLGVGVASTRELDERVAPTAARPEGHSYPLRTGRHAHNVFMQTWYELGAVGALLLMGLGLAVLAALRRLPRGQLPYAHATFVAATIVGCFSWGMWQTWFMAAYAVTAVLLALALEVAERRALDESRPIVA